MLKTAPFVCNRVGAQLEANLKPHKEHFDEPHADEVD